MLRSPFKISCPSYSDPYHVAEHSKPTLVTASIHITAMLVHIRSVEIRPSIVSTETKRGMDAAMQVAEATARNSVHARPRGRQVERIYTH